MEIVAEAAVSFAVETLGKLLIEKAVFLKGVKGDVEWVREELRNMQCFLKDAAKKQSDSESIRKWISDIRKVAHDAEDAIEIFVLNVESRGLKKRYACFPSHFYHINKVGKQIKSIRKTLKDIQERRVRYDIQRLGDHQRVEPRSRSQEEAETQRRLAYWQNDKHVVGLYKDVELLLGNAIFEKSNSLSVAAILGMGGIGKSTLASKIYNHPAVAGRFEFRAWVVVSSEFTPEDILKQILLQLGISLDDLKRLESVDDKVGRQENLKKEVYKRLTGKRYFIVLDDVWEAAHWESFTSAFPDQGKASRLLLTSRNRVITTDFGYVHNMKALDENESWDLFMTRAFIDNTNKCPPELMNIGKEILKKCGGLPLGINVVGGLLAKKTRSISEWDKVLKEMKYHLDRSEDLNTISAISELSYQNLTPELKACFLCLGFFKEDATLDAQNLVHIWVAQGLVREEVIREGESKEDAARAYLNELISRNMVQVKEMEYDRVISCHVHDLLLDLSIRKAKEEIDFEVATEEGNSHQSLDKPRYRAIHCNGLRFVWSTKRSKYLRSLFIHAENKHDMDGCPSSYWKSFDLLRLLDFGNSKFPELPEGIGTLAGLRYLKIGFMQGILKLPRSWSSLKNLEVLDIQSYSGEIIIDRVILKMHSLRHFYSRISRSEVALGEMRSLETLKSLILKDSDVQQIQGMTNVSQLGIDMNNLKRRFVSSAEIILRLARLENLAGLTLRLDIWVNVDLAEFGALHRITQLTLEGYMPKFPSNIPPNVSYMTLSRLSLKDDPMPVLERLSKLLFLKLSESYYGEEMVVSRCGFPALRVLHLESSYNLKNIEIEEGGMPELDRFLIRRCRCLNVVNLPEHLQSAIADE